MSLKIGGSQSSLNRIGGIKNRRKLRTFFSVFNLSDPQPEENTENNFRSFVTNSYLETNEVSQKNYEIPIYIIEKFIDDERLFIKDLEFLLMVSKYSDPEDTFQLYKILNELQAHQKDIFMPELLNSDDRLKACLKHFNTDGPIFKLFRQLFCQIYVLKLYEDISINTKKVFSSDFYKNLNKPEKRITRYIEFLNLLKDIFIEDTEKCKDISHTISSFDKVRDIEEELQHNLLWKLINCQILQLENCKMFMAEVMSVLENGTINKTFRKLGGQVHEIYDCEISIANELKNCLIRNDFNEVVKVYLKHMEIFYLYTKNEKRNYALLDHFCTRNKINQNLFYFIISHLFNLKRIFNSASDCMAAQELAFLIDKTLETVDNLNAANRIYGENIILEQQGDILLRSRFHVKFEKRTAYLGMVFLFEKAVVFTIEEKHENYDLAYLFQSSIPLDQIGISYSKLNPQHMKVFHQIGKRKTDVHTMLQINANDNTIELWKNQIFHILRQQINHIKNKK